MVPDLLKPAPAITLLCWLAGCASQPATAPSVPALQARNTIAQALPRTVSDRSGWTDDIYQAFVLQNIEPTPENVCATVAVIEQESGFQVNPVVPNLGNIAREEIRTRAGHAGVPWLLVQTALGVKSAGGLTYSQRIDRARTEKDLSDIYEDFLAAIPLGERLFADHNPIRTRGPMQVNIAFLKQTEATKSYPYPVRTTLADELFTRRGSVYFGVAHLLGYPATYNMYLYRFADFNAGQYASRNAGFQVAISAAAGERVVPDGALLPPNAGESGSTELAIRSLQERLNINAAAIHLALEQSKSLALEQTAVYRRVYALAEQRQGHPAAYATIPRIRLQSPKITRNLTTEWYAHRVDGRFQRCLKHGPG